MFRKPKKSEKSETKIRHWGEKLQWRNFFVVVVVVVCVFVCVCVCVCVCVSLPLQGTGAKSADHL